MAPDSASRIKTISFGLLRWGLFLLVLWYVATQARVLWEAHRDIDVQFDWKYLVTAGVVSQLSWLPSTWFWKRLIERLGERNLETYPLIRAYFCGSLGKYVPGKAAVILIRSALVRKQGVSFVRASIASIVEAGAVMLVGCVVTVVFAFTIMPPDALPRWMLEAVPRESSSWSHLLITVVILILAMPIVAVPANGIFVKIARMVEKRSQLKPGEKESPEKNCATPITTNSHETTDHELTDSVIGKLTWQFLAVSSLMFALAWAGHGLSLLLVLRSMNPEVFSLDNWIVSTAAAAAGTSIGFFAIFAPGGLAVREGLVITLLAPSMGGPVAVAAAGLYRLASLIAESAAALILYVIPPRTGTVASDGQTSTTATEVCGDETR
ncbi:MAG: flippase-like domain-containing protein [Rhodopirellula sp.]|nr:flippase-like domain-containing protein [Rhodopirellula sp.]